MALSAFYEDGELKQRVVLVLDRSPQKAEDHEVDPDPYAKAEDHEVDPDPYTKAEDHEVDPDPYAKLVRTWTVLAVHLSAELANGWGDDEEVFRFRIGEARSVAVAVVGEAVSLGLFDQAGRRIATAADGLLVSTLAAGEYFVRGSGVVPGEYELLLE